MSQKFTYIGYVAKTHGLHGVMSIKLEKSKKFCELSIDDSIMLLGHLEAKN